MRKADHPLYRTWKGIRSRCLCKSNIGFKYYGGRGIKLCERWNDFYAFVEDMGARPSKNHQVERIDNGGDYSPGNCRWATRIEQQSNTKRNRFMVLNGVVRTLSEWGRVLGIPKSTIRFRVKKGWDDVRALSPKCM